VAKKKGDWWRIPVGIGLAIAAIPIYWTRAAQKYFSRKSDGGDQ